MAHFYSELAILIISIITVIESSIPTLRFVNVVFRHGDKTPDASGKQFYPNDPYLKYDFSPVGLGQLTENGKQRAYNLGLALQGRYSNFLGQYTSGDIVARSTDFGRTKTSLSLVVNGLYPPTIAQQTWGPVLYSKPAIPLTYASRNLDFLLLSDECPRYLEELKRVRSLPEVVNKVNKFRQLMDYLTYHTGKIINDTKAMYDLYQGLAAEGWMGLPLPLWTNSVFPQGALLDATVLEYEIANYNNLLKKLNGGPLLKRFSEDMVAAVKGTKKKARKMNLFGAHETNIAGILQALGVYLPHVPQYSSAVIVELFELEGYFFVKVIYYTGIPAVMVDLVIPGCDVLCPLQNFLQLMSKVTPNNDEMTCKNESNFYWGPLEI